MGYLRATLDTQKLSGEVGRSITVYSNDPVTPSLSLTLRANVRGSVRVFPQPSVRMDNRRPEGTLARLLVRKEIDESGELAVADLEASAEWLTVTARRLDGTSSAAAQLPAPWPGDWLIEVEWSGHPGYGRNEQTVRFKTGLRREPEVEIPVNVMAWPPVNLSTERLVLEASGEGRPKTETVVFSLRRGLDPSQLKVRGEPASLGVQIEPSGKRHFRLLASWPGGDEREGSIYFDLGTERYRLPVELRPGG